MLHQLASVVKGGSLILFVVPFVSLAEEKANYFRSMWADVSGSTRLYLLYHIP
jgi:replicative superfamily II helicase